MAQQMRNHRPMGRHCDTAPRVPKRDPIEAALEALARLESTFAAGQAFVGVAMDQMQHGVEILDPAFAEAPLTEVGLSDDRQARRFGERTDRIDSAPVRACLHRINPVLSKHFDKPLRLGVAGLGQWPVLIGDVLARHALGMPD